MVEILRVPLRVVGVVLPASLVLLMDELRGAANEDGFGVFLSAMALSMLACGVWAARDLSDVRLVRALVRWVLVVVLVAAGGGLAIVLTVPGGPPSERIGELVGLTTFFAVPLFITLGVALLVGLSRRGQKIPE